MTVEKSKAGLGGEPIKQPAEQTPHLELIQRPNIDFGIFIPSARDQILTNTAIEDWGVKTRNGTALTAKIISKATGVERRHIADPYENVLFMGEAAALHLFPQRGNIPVDLTIFTTTYPIRIAEPENDSLARRVNTDMGISGEYLDIFAACAGFTRALAYLKDHEKYYLNKRVLLVSSEKHSDKVIDLREKGATEEDPSLSQLLMTDAAIATYFVYGRDLIVLNAVTKDLGHSDLIKAPYFGGLPAVRYVQEPNRGIQFWPKMLQQGKQLSDLVIETIPGVIEETTKGAGLTPADIDFVVTHQPSAPLLKKLRSALGALGYDPEKFVMDIEDGNSSSASVPKALRKAILEGRIVKGQKGILASFAAGMTTAVVAVQI